MQPLKNIFDHEFQNPIYFEYSLDIQSFKAYFLSLSSRFIEKMDKIYVNHEDDQEKTISF
jgi:hypothetical protein